MDNDGQEAATLPPMEGDRAPIPEENRARVVGYLTRRPFVTEVAAGTGSYKKALFTLMVPRTYKDGDGKKRRVPSFVSVVAWRALASQVEGAGKDSVVLVEGHLQSWSDPEGKQFRLELSAELLEVLRRRDSPTDEGPRKKEAATV